MASPLKKVIARLRPTPIISTFMLKDLLDRKVQDAALAMVWDPGAVKLAFEVGEGAELDIRLGGKLGLDATNKIGTETDRDWGRVLEMSPEVIGQVDAIWAGLGLGGLTR